MGDAALSAEEAAFNFGTGGIVGTHSQFLDMIADGQASNGELSDITPTVWQIGPMQPCDPNWGSAYPTIAHTVWTTSGSTAVVHRHLDNVVAYIGSLQRAVKANGLGKLLKKYGGEAHTLGVHGACRTVRRRRRRPQ